MGSSQRRKESGKGEVESAAPADLRVNGEIKRTGTMALGSAVRQRVSSFHRLHPHADDLAPLRSDAKSDSISKKALL